MSEQLRPEDTQASPETTGQPAADSAVTPAQEDGLGDFLADKYTAQLEAHTARLRGEHIEDGLDENGRGWLSGIWYNDRNDPGSYPE